MAFAPPLPMSLTTTPSTWTTKYIIRRIQMELNRGSDPKWAEYLQLQLEDLSIKLSEDRYMEKRFTNIFNANDMVGRKNFHLREIKSFNRWVNQHTFSRRFMRKTFGIDRGVTVFPGDVFVSPHNIKAQIVDVGDIFVEGKPIKVVIAKLYDEIKPSRYEYKVDCIRLEQFVDKFRLYQSFEE